MNFESKPNEKLTVQYNPYLYEETQIAVTTVDQIQFTHHKLNGTKEVGEFLKDQDYSKWTRILILRMLMRHWSKDFKTKQNEKRDELFSKAAIHKKKKIRKFNYTSIYAFLFICVMGIMIKMEVFHLKKLSLFLNRPLFNNLFVLLIYISLIASLYMIISKAYYDATRLVSHDSKKFILQEIRTVKNQFLIQQKTIKNHLRMKIFIKRYNEVLKLKQIYDELQLVMRLEKYRVHIQNKMAHYSKNYYVLLVIAFLFKAIVALLIIYLSISYIKG